MIIVAFEYSESLEPPALFSLFDANPDEMDSVVNPFQGRK